MHTQRMTSVSSISGAASLMAAAPARAATRRHAAATLSIRSEISCECLTRCMLSLLTSQPVVRATLIVVLLLPGAASQSATLCASL
jgi:hypothetical protein